MNCPTLSRLCLLFLSSALVLLATPALADDTIFLKNGGRVRGTIVESDPSTSTRIKLLDGTMKTIKAADIDHIDSGDAKPAPTPAPSAPIAASPPQAAVVGSIRIASEEPGVASIDGGEIGKTPAEARSLAPGRHKVRVDFAAGGAAEKFVMIQPGDNEEVKLEPSAARKVARYREGLHFGARAGVVAPLIETDKGVVVFGGTVGGFANLGASPAIDLRLGVQFDIEHTSGEISSNQQSDLSTIGLSMYSLAFPATLRFNLGSFYTMSIGARGGVLFLEEPADESSPCLSDFTCDSHLASFGFVGPTWSVLGLRLGEKRNLEIDFEQGFDFAPDLDHGQSVPYSFNGPTNYTFEPDIHHGILYRQTFTVSYLFL